MDRITEQQSIHRNLETKSSAELVAAINSEDKKVALEIEKSLPKIADLIEVIVSKLERGGRLFYVGAGSGGRLAVLDVIELPTTYGIPKGMINVILAGGVEHLAEALEEEEDNIIDGWLELKKNQVSRGDVIIGISASGTTPFVLETLKKCKEEGIVTGCIVSNPDSAIASYSDYPIEVITGPEFVTGSTRMKCGTAQKMIFDMISTTAMIRLNRVQDTSMIHVALINDKITDRAVKILMKNTGIENYEDAKALLLKHGSVDKAQKAQQSVSHK